MKQASSIYYIPRIIIYIRIAYKKYIEGSVNNFLGLNWGQQQRRDLNVHTHVLKVT